MRANNPMAPSARRYSTCIKSFNPYHSIRKYILVYPRFTDDKLRHREVRSLAQGHRTLSGRVGVRTRAF